jgi:hypothetical protein
MARRRRRAPLSREQVVLLRAVGAGNVVWRHAPRSGWSIRRRDVVSGPSGDLGARVTGAVGHLAARGLVVVPKADGLVADAPIELTDFGKITLELDNIDQTARLDAVAMPHLPMSLDGREPFPAGSDGDAPDHALLDLTNDDLDHPGWWQRHGDWWVPVVPPHTGCAEPGAAGAGAAANGGR